MLINVSEIRKFIAFTLAEVLIVLGIIGIVSEMTIPPLVTSFQKQVTVAKVQKFYSVMEQAIRLSESENGPLDQWSYSPNTPDGMKIWFDTYLAPYMRYSSITVGSGYIIVNFQDGTIVNFYNFNKINIWVFTDGSNQAIWNRNIFVFEITPLDQQKMFRPWDVGLTGTDRTAWQSGPQGCNKTSAQPKFCAGLMMYDGWRIADDYPW